MMMFILNCCISTKRYNGFITQKITTAPVAGLPDEKGYISFVSDKLIATDTPVKTTKLKSIFIPALFYWEWESTMRCEINPLSQVAKVNRWLLYYADSTGLREKLDGRTLEISFEKIPDSFIYSNRGSTIFMIVAYEYSGGEAIFPLDQHLKVTYRIMNGGSEVQNGTIDVANDLKPVTNFVKSTRKFTWNYLDQYDSDLKLLSKKLIDSLQAEI